MHLALARIVVGFPNVWMHCKSTRRMPMTGRQEKPTVNQLLLTMVFEGVVEFVDFRSRGVEGSSNRNPQGQGDPKLLESRR